ncbi:MAG: GTPase HflX [Spirochaetales bacterium]|nr:GTPase HflX [Spirochaetales bacterium]
MEEYEKPADKATLVGVTLKGEDRGRSQRLLDELERLAASLGFTAAEKILVSVDELKPRYLLGSGKAEEIAARAAEAEAEYIIFDNELSPSQQRNWETMTGLCVIDRHEVILEIFAARAQTREAALQVGLARMEYSLPRLTRAWTHLSRQRGGMRGTRDKGETQLETDRRVVLKKIAGMKKELEQVKVHRTVMRSRRDSRAVPTAALVGYTNAGKSSLMKALTGSDVLIEDKLFATLDPATRQMALPGGAVLLLHDTVGFIRNLPHDLVEAFSSTLEEVVLSDFLILVLDASDPEVSEHRTTCREVLAGLGVGDKPVVTVLNKTDRMEDPRITAFLNAEGDHAVSLSARTGEGLSELTALLETTVFDGVPVREFHIPHSRLDLASLARRTGRVITENYEDSILRMTAQVPAACFAHLKEFVRS